MSDDGDVWAADADKDSACLLPSSCLVDADKDTETTPFVEVHSLVANQIIVIEPSTFNLWS